MLRRCLSEMDKKEQDESTSEEESYHHQSGVVAQTPLHHTGFGQRPPGFDCPQKADQDRTKNSRAAVSASLRDFVSGFSALYGRSTLPVRWHLSLDAKFSCGYVAKDFVFGSLNFSDSQRQVSYRLSILLCHNKLTIFTLSALSGCSWHCFSWGSKPFNFLPVFICWIQSWPFWMNSSLSWKVETTAVHSPCLTWTCLLSTGYYCSVGAVWIGQSL